MSIDDDTAEIVEALIIPGVIVPLESKISLSIVRDHLDGVEFYRGTITHSTTGVMYEVTRWSEQAVKQALIRYIYSVGGTR